MLPPLESADQPEPLPPPAEARPSAAPVPPPDRVSISRGQLRGLMALLAVNVLILIGLAGLALQQPIVQWVLVTPPSPPLATRTALPTFTPTPPPTPTPTPISPFGGGGAIAFTLRRNGNSDIYAVNAGDKQLIRLVSQPADDRDPAISPDGQDLAFASHRDGNWEIYRLNFASGLAARLTFTTTYDGAPAWSPDGQQIVFESYREGNLDLYRHGSGRR